ncbi:unnamed protein product, partial [Mesorhabditis belari]|uniref:F-box domain-containing protein n=1 Tax=Mesorhabditis belari TaxID=2138241 RepID=A0AAF3ES76_9BILA
MSSSFCYRILPEELKNSVLSSVSLKDVQELYKVNKNLQTKILNEPLPRKISNLGIFVVDDEDPLKISLFVSLNREIDFRIYETTVHLVEELNENEIPLKISPQTFWDFLKPIISIKFCELLLHSSIENAPLYSSSLYKNFENGNFLPKASHISSLSLRTTTKYANTIFSKFDAKIVNFLKLGFNIFDEPDGAIGEFLSTALQKPNVRTCKAITWRFSMVSIDQLAICDSKLLIIEEIWNENFQQTIEKIIAENLGKEKETMLLFYYRVYEDAIFQDCRVLPQNMVPLLWEPCWRRNSQKHSEDLEED